VANVLYIVWWEGVRDSALIDTQVYRLLGTIARESRHTLTLLSGGAFWRRGMALWARRLGVRRGRADYLDRRGFSIDGVRVLFRNTLQKPAGVYLPWWRLTLAVLPHLGYLSRLVDRHGIEIVHCRSYFPAFLAVMCRRRFKKRYRIVFDPRGLLCDEAVSLGYFRRGGISLRCWRGIERLILAEADHTVALSVPFERLLQEMGAAPAKTSVIFPCVDITRFTRKGHPHDAGWREYERRTAGKRVLCFLGAISQQMWHSFENLARLYQMFKLRFGRTLLAVVTAVDSHLVYSSLQAYGIRREDIWVGRAAVEDVPAYLGRATYGAVPFKRAEGPADLRIGSTMMPTKVGEYLAAGLPILCSDRLEAICSIVDEYGVGHKVPLDLGTEPGEKGKRNSGSGN